MSAVVVALIYAAAFALRWLTGGPWLSLPLYVMAVTGIGILAGVLLLPDEEAA